MLLWSAVGAGPGAVVGTDGTTVHGSGGAWATVRASAAHSDGKRCFEVTLVAADQWASLIVGMVRADAPLSGVNPGFSGASFGAQWIAGATGLPWVAGGVARTALFNTPASAVAGDVITIAVDFDAGYAWMARNGAWITGDPAAGTGPLIMQIGGGQWFPAVGVYSAANVASLNGGPTMQHCPAGFAAWAVDAEAPSPIDPQPPALSWTRNAAPVRYQHSPHGHDIERIDVLTYMRVISPQTAAETRQRLINYVWPQGRPLGTFAAAQASLSVPGAMASEVWTIAMPHGYTSTSHMLRSAVAGNCLMIINGGHELQPVRSLPHYMAQIATPLLAQGCDVVIMDMPCYGDNAHPAYPQHDTFAALDSSTFSAMSYFIEPVSRAIDVATASKAYARIGMTGLSGGGWTTAVAGAIDTRLTHLYPVAGSMPLVTDIDPSISGGVNVSSKRGDYEQSLPAFYALASYFDLYAMGVTGGRRAMHFYTTGDLFPAWARLAWSDELMDIAREDIAEGGRLLFREDRTALAHVMSAWAAASIVRDFMR